MPTTWEAQDRTTTDRALDITLGILRAIHPHTSVRRDTLMLTFYLDDTEDYHSRIFSMCGYVAHEAMWDEFITNWDQALSAAGVSQFHATDFFSCRGEFEGWVPDSKRHRQFERKFSAIAESMVTLGKAQGVVLAGFDRHMRKNKTILKHTPNGRMTPHMWCAMQCLLWLSKKSGRPIDEPIAVIVERGKGNDEAINYLNWLKGREVPWMAPYVTIAPGGKELLPLQAADLLANHTQRELIRHLDSPGSKPHRSMERLLKGGLIQMDVQTDENLATMVHRMEDAIRSGDQAVIADLSGTPRGPAPDNRPLWLRKLPKPVRRLYYRLRNFLRGRGFVDG